MNECTTRKIVGGFKGVPGQTEIERISTVKWKKNFLFTVALDRRDNGKSNHRAAQTHGAGHLSQLSEISQIASSCIRPKLLASPGAVWQQSTQLKIRHRARSLGHTTARSLVS